jgi:hypothetical protein
MAVVGDVIARHHGERLHAGCAAFLQAGKDEAEDGLRLVRIGGVRDDIGMLRIELLRGGVDEIAALGDRRRDDLRRRVGKLVDNLGGVARLDEVDHRAGDAGFHDVRVLLDDGRQPILLLQLLAAGLFEVEHPCPDDREIMVSPGVEQFIFGEPMKPATNRLRGRL